MYWFIRLGRSFQIFYSLFGFRVSTFGKNSVSFRTPGIVLFRDWVSLWMGGDEMFTEHRLEAVAPGDTSLCSCFSPGRAGCHHGVKTKGKWMPLIQPLWRQADWSLWVEPSLVYTATSRPTKNYRVKNLSQNNNKYNYGIVGHDSTLSQIYTK